MVARNRDRIGAAFRRLGVKPILGGGQIPHLDKYQIKMLQDLYPVRLLEPGEAVDAYRHYCGAAALVQLLADFSDRADITDDPQEVDEVLDAEAVGRAIAMAHNGTTYEED